MMLMYAVYICGSTHPRNNSFHSHLNWIHEDRANVSGLGYTDVYVYVSHICVPFLLNFLVFISPLRTYNTREMVTFQSRSNSTSNAQKRSSFSTVYLVRWLRVAFSKRCRCLSISSSRSSRGGTRLRCCIRCFLDIQFRSGAICFWICKRKRKNHLT